MRSRFQPAVWIGCLLALAGCQKGGGPSTIYSYTTEGSPQQVGQLPKPDPKFEGQIAETYKDSKPSYPAPVKAREGSPNVLLILLEGVRNVGRHARARAASLRAHHAAGQVVITIDDDGVGFGEGGTPPWAIASRVAECNGELHSHADEGGGAHLLIRLPEER